MAGLEDYLPSFFKPGDISDPRVNPQLRQKIAAALLAKEQRFPKTIGEGLSAIGEAIGQRRLISDIYQNDIAAQNVQPPAAAGAAPTASTSYGGGDATPPAVAAIERAITPASGGEPSDGGYNFIDAQAGGRFKPTPGYLQDTIAAREPNPDMQAYFGSLAGSEAKGPRDVSPTGAAGPYQFTRGTGAQYGIPGAARMDPGASTDAVRALTADNAATFQQVNNRPPTYQDLALMHQQGGTTGARMAAGTGNAPPGNLAVNNIPPGASPQQAVSKVNAFYGMPNEPAPVASRDAIAAQLTPKPPADQSGQALALTASPASPAIATAPPAAPIRQAPPQVAQAEPQQYPPGYIPPEPGTPQGAPIIQPGQRETELSNWLAAETARGNRQYAEPKVALELQALQNARAQRQSEANKIFEANLARATTQANKRLEAQTGQAKALQDYQKEQQSIIPQGVPSSGVLPGGGSTFVPGASSTTPRNFDPRLLGTDASPQRTGVPTPPPMPSGITPQQWAEEQKTRTAKMNDAIDKATPELRKSIELINLARTHPGLDWGTGATGEFMRERAGTSAYAFGSLMKQITGKNFMAGYQDLRGAGNIGEKEGAKAEQAQASIDPNQSKEDLKASLQRLEDTLRNNVEVAQRATNRPVTAWQTSPNDPYAPDIGQIGKDAKTGKLQQYIGGNPKLDSSYRDVR